MASLFSIRVFKSCSNKRRAGQLRVYRSRGQGQASRGGGVCSCGCTCRWSSESVIRLVGSCQHFDHLSALCDKAGVVGVKSAQHADKWRWSRHEATRRREKKEATRRAKRQRHRHGATHRQFWSYRTHRDIGGIRGHTNKLMGVASRDARNCAAILRPSFTNHEYGATGIAEGSTHKRPKRREMERFLL